MILDLASETFNVDELKLINRSRECPSYCECIVYRIPYIDIEAANKIQKVKKEPFRRFPNALLENLNMALGKRDIGCTSI